MTATGDDQSRPGVEVRLSDRIVTVAARCPHKGAPLSEASVIGAFLECPWHGATFDLRSGRRLRGPDCGDLEILECTHTGNSAETVP
jgi:nitrite reductase/ring-hydroxylating ferredoxin subunit